MFNLLYFRYRRERYRKGSSRTFRGRRKLVTNPSLPQQKRDSLKSKLEISKHKPMFQCNSQNHVRRQHYRRHDTEVPIMSQKGLSVQEFGGINHNRRYIKESDPELTVDDESKVLERIKHLENQLNEIKTHIENNTNTEDLVYQVQNDVKSKTVDNFSLKGPDVYGKVINEQLPNLNQEVQVIVSKNDANRIQSKSNTDNEAVSPPFEPNDDSHGRKYLPNSEFKEISQLDEENKKVNNSFFLNTPPFKHVNHNSSEYNIKRSVTNKKQKDVKTELLEKNVKKMEQDQKVNN